MTWSRVKTALRTQFETAVTVPNELVVKLGNEPAGAADETWVRVSARGATRQLATTGGPQGRKWRRAGILFVQCFVPLEEGEAELEQLVDKVEAAFLGVELTDNATPKIVVRCRAPFADGEAEKDTETWWKQLVHIPFEADEYGGAAP